MELVQYEKTKGTVQINPAKYFEGISSELWDYHIGGYQVLNKYLKYRKGKSLEDPIHYCRMVTTLAKLVDYQAQIKQIIVTIIQ